MIQPNTMIRSRPVTRDSAVPAATVRFDLSRLLAGRPLTRCSGRRSLLPGFCHRSMQRLELDDEVVDVLGVAVGVE